MSRSLPVASKQASFLFHSLINQRVCPTCMSCHVCCVGAQWIDSVLASGMETDFYVDQYRCPIFVKDVVRVIELLIVTILQGRLLQLCSLHCCCCFWTSWVPAGAAQDEFEPAHSPQRVVGSAAGGGHVQLLLNMGGTERMSRAGMAETVARVRGRNISLINRASFSSVSQSVSV